jgi:lipopolysaccharide transport protein LptA
MKFDEQPPSQSTHTMIWVVIVLSSTHIPATLAADTGLKLPSGQVTVVAERVVLDMHAGNAVSFHAVVRQGEWTATADRLRVDAAHKDNSDWQLDGSVILRSPGAQINADSGTLKVAEKTVRTVHLFGGPVTFRLNDAKLPEEIHGDAGELDLDLEARLIRLSNNAYAAMGGYEVTAPLITYDIDARYLHTDPIIHGQQSHFRIPETKDAQ